MALKLKSIVPWGRSYSEYIQMFDLQDNELSNQIIGIGDGPASFNSGMKNRGFRIISCDPIYEFTRDEIEQRILESNEEIKNQIYDNKENYIWTNIKSPEELFEIRLNAMNSFLKDYDNGKLEKRYLSYALPELPFEAQSFKIALSSHLLFTYEDKLDYEFHLSSILEMLRIAEEVRIFPILNMDSERSQHMLKIIITLEDLGYNPRTVKVDYEFQKNGNEMLRIRQ